MRSFFRVLSVILLVLWMGVIFFFSEQTAVNSSQTSGQVIEILAEKFYPEFEQMTEEEKQEVISSMQFIVRKSAHIGVFAVLGIFAFLTFVSYVDLRFFTRTFLAAAVGIIYAASDEYHQRFVAGRSCELRDFLIDTAGVVAAILICTAFVKVIGPLRRKTAYEGVSKKKLKAINLELYEKLDEAQYQNHKLERKVNENEQIIEQLETQLQWKEAASQAVKEPEKLIFEEPFVEVEKEIIETDETIANISTVIDNEEESELLNQESDQEVTEEIEASIETETVNLQPVETEKKKMKLDNEMEYAAKVIGDCVVEVTKLCNNITVSENNDNQKELVNLALGRCEVLKAEILKIISSDIEFSQKKDLIEKEQKDTFDYFDSIKAQMC